jgi:hypothetical protein
VEYIFYCFKNSKKKQPSHGVWSYLLVIATGYEKQFKLWSRAAPPRDFEVELLLVGPESLPNTSLKREAPSCVTMPNTPLKREALSHVVPLTTKIETVDVQVIEVVLYRAIISRYIVLVDVSSTLSWLPPRRRRLRLAPTRTSKGLCILNLEDRVCRGP